MVAVEKVEKRTDAQTAREVEVALPIELNHREQVRLLKKFIFDTFVKEGMCADVYVHDTGNGNSHAHILLTMRRIGASGFRKKERGWNKKDLLIQ